MNEKFNNATDETKQKIKIREMFLGVEKDVKFNDYPQINFFCLSCPVEVERKGKKIIATINSIIIRWVN